MFAKGLSSMLRIEHLRGCIFRLVLHDPNGASVAEYPDGTDNHSLISYDTQYLLPDRFSYLNGAESAQFHDGNA